MYETNVVIKTINILRFNDSILFSIKFHDNKAMKIVSMFNETNNHKEVFFKKYLFKILVINGTV
ncbi:hypothetical protein STURON_0075 [Spiroplasma turonicum]|uniref:Uncharacterized protein n=1 Tax=Spiroplasma turonicum TaxID=216946 RepID=A0A0K1P4V1_9MOLU|nr:hypothetical protein STURON_0075 [Spiroplasma turonicum]